jgi:hypothetical protein
MKINSPLTEGFLKSDFVELELPEELAKRFDLLERIGFNSFSNTFIVSEKDTKDLYVLKMQTNPEIAMDNEALLLQNLKHKGLPVYEKPHDSGNTRYTLRKYIKGEPLDGYLSSVSSVNIPQMIDALLSMCDILVYLHSQPEPIIHRDIKPSNIIFNPETREVMLIDFGISRKFRKDIKKDTVYFGTHEYAPPEQYGFAQTDCRTDIYSFGVVVRYWLTGATDNKTKIQDSKLERIASKCTALDPQSRFQSATALKKALLRYKNRGKRFAATSAIAALAVITVGLGVYASSVYNDPVSDDPPVVAESPDVDQTPDVVQTPDVDQTPDVVQTPANQQTLTGYQTPVGYDDYEFQKLVGFFTYEDNLSKIQAQYVEFSIEIPGAWWWEREEAIIDNDGTEYTGTNFIIWYDGRVHEIFLYGLGLTGELDVSGFRYLTVLDIASNDLTSLNVSGCVSLRELRVGNNSLTSLDLTGLPALIDVHYYWNPFTEPVKHDG